MEDNMLMISSVCILLPLPQDGFDDSIAIEKDLQQGPGLCDLEKIMSLSLYLLGKYGVNIAYLQELL